jgi:hypothetical protein
MVVSIRASSSSNTIAGVNQPITKCHPKFIFDIDKTKLYLNLNKEFCNFTNNFLEISSVKNIPISYIYGNADELCMFRNNDYSTDYESFLTTKLTKIHANQQISSESQADIVSVATSISQIKSSESKSFKFINSTKNHTQFNLTYFRILLALSNSM